MRPHRVRLSAFGPFAGTVELDVDALSAGGLFLLYGDTGAGKTTVLDAVGFALYGTVPGARGTARRLRSDHARPGQPTVVELEFTAGGRRLRVTRSPEWSRPKKRGTGTVKVHACVQLDEWRGGDWVCRSTRVGEADEEILRAVGMSAAQFFQVVLLPQGDFARFLRSDSADRGALLERLFGLERFRAVEVWLADRRKTTTEAAAGAVEQVQRAAERLLGAAGRDGEPRPEPVTADLVATVLGELDEALAAAGERLHAAAGRRAAAEAAAEAARSLADRQALRVRLLAEQAALTARAPEVDRARAALAAAERAAPVAALLAGADDAATRAAAAARDARRALAGADPDVLAGSGGTGLATGTADASGALPSGTAAALAAAHHRAAARVATLAALSPLAGSVRALDRELASAGQEVDALAVRVVALATAVEQAPVRRSAAAAALAAAEGHRDTVAALAAELDRVHRAAADVARHREVDAAVAGAAPALLAAREAVVEARETHQDLRNRRLDAAAAELAGLLADGDECPVCGALEHPHPMAARADAVSRANEDAAQAAVDTATARRERLEREQAERVALRGELAGRVVALDPTALADPEALTARLAGAQARHAAAVAAAARVEPCRAELERLAAAEARLREEQATAVEAARAAQQRVVDARAARDGRVAELAVHGVDAAGLPAARTAAEAEVRARAALHATVQAAERAAEAAAAGWAEVGRAAAAAGFADLEAVRTAAGTAARRAELAATVTAHDEARHRVAGRLEAPELDVADLPPADPAGAREPLRAAVEAHEQAVRTHATCAARRLDARRAAPVLERALAEVGPLVAEAAAVREAADVAAGLGSNHRRMTLSAFVAAARLEQVAAVASERLLRMTSGRYTLVHHDGRARSNARSGLGLWVRDAWTGQDRDTATLSGGETFVASLALALGLADTVTAEAGAAPVETLFVDEGFGSLDETTLDEVMDVLDGLREGGRVIGVVSHVAELRARIPVRVHVERTPTGSRLGTTLGAA